MPLIYRTPRRKDGTYKDMVVEPTGRLIEIGDKHIEVRTKVARGSMTFVARVRRLILMEK